MGSLRAVRRDWRFSWPKEWVFPAVILRVASRERRVSSFSARVGLVRMVGAVGAVIEAVVFGIREFLGPDGGGMGRNFGS